LSSEHSCEKNLVVDVTNCRLREVRILLVLMLGHDRKNAEVEQILIDELSELVQRRSLEGVTSQVAEDSVLLQPSQHLIGRLGTQQLILL